MQNTFTSRLPVAAAVTSVVSDSVYLTSNLYHLQEGSRELPSSNECTATRWKKPGLLNHTLRKPPKLDYCMSILRRRQWHPTPVLLPGKSHGRRSLVGCSPWGPTESDTTERLPFHFSLSCIGEGNGNPLQCPCLESPRDGGAWWAAVYGITESDTTEAT